VWARDDAGACLIVSNAHVVTRTPIQVVGLDRVSRPASLLARDATRDLALLLVRDASATWRPIPPATAPVRAGAVVMAIGHPLGVAHAMTSGVVHAVGSLPAGTPLPAPAHTLAWLQLDLRLAPGNSGGPVIDAHGGLVGVSTMIVGGLGLAIPASDIDRFVHAADGTRHLAHGWTRAA
jgi:serine protease Do